VLGFALGRAAAQDQAAQGAVLLFLYSLGLGVPFMVTGLAFGRLAGALNWVKRHSTAITATSAVALGFFGVLLVMNQFTWLTIKLQQALDSVGLDWMVTLG
jgi:cytochrome c-type biogenesis protein